MLFISMNTNPTIQQIERSMRSAEGHFIRFLYECQRPIPRTPSRRAADADTDLGSPVELIQGILSARPSLSMPESSTFFKSKAGDTLFRMFPSTRRKAQPAGEGYYASQSYTANYVRGQYLPRSFLLQGIQLDSVVVANGRQGLVRLFPAVALEVIA